jgi:hypothetical protein
MVAPDTFTLSAAGTADSAVNVVSKAGDYWFALSFSTAGTAQVPTVRYASDPAGAWGTATMPAAPATYEFVSGSPFRHGVVFDGSQYAFGLSYRNAGATATETYAFYASDPTGTWARSQIGTSSNLDLADFIHDGTQFIAVGRGVTSNNPWIAYCSTANGTWTLNNTEATTGYLPTADWRIESIDFDGTQYVTVATGPGTDGARYSTSLTSGWAAPTSFPTTLGTLKNLRYYGAVDTWVVADGANTNYYYATDPTDTWTAIGSASTGMTDGVFDMAYGSGYWLAAGNTLNGSFYDVPRVAYLSGPSPAGTYTTVDDGFTDRPEDNTRAWSAWYADSYFVIGANGYGEVAYCFVGAVTAPRLLRQRQSPKRTPARVRGVDLRQRQTPFIR